MQEFYSISSIETLREYFLSSSFRYWYVSIILSICSGKSVFWRFPFSKYSLALIISTSSYFLHFLSTKIHTGIPVEKNKFAGKPMIASIFPSLRSFVLIFSSAPPRGVKDSEFQIHHGDSLLNDWNILNEMNPAKKMQFEAVVANPPFSYRWQPKEEMAEDFRIVETCCGV